jgi:uncharacterized glyoxalase superfamily protein PhnB
MPTQVIDEPPTEAAPYLVVEDVERSVQYYKEVLGFRVDMIDCGFALVSRDKVSIMLQQKAVGQCHHHGPMAGYVWVNNVDGSRDELEARGATVCRPVADMRWGTREFEVQDPDGYLLRFGQILITCD